MAAGKDGVEFDRAVGLKQPAELLSWLDGVMWGENSLVKLTAEAAEQPANMFGRMKLARALANAGKLDQATDAYVWLWQHVLEHDPAMVGVRFSFMLAEIGDLVGRHPPARTKFATLRDAAAPKPESVPASFDDWVALNQALGELEKTLQWFDREREQLASKTELARRGRRSRSQVAVEVAVAGRGRRRRSRSQPDARVGTLSCV
jgi:hypothetical protein